MKILWLAPIPVIEDKNSHPAPWIISLGEKLVENGNLLTIINYSSTISEKIVKKEINNIQLVYIKTPILKIDFISLYKLRINKIRKYLKQVCSEFDILHIHGTEHQYQMMAHNLKIPKVISIQGIISEYIKFVPITNYKVFLEWKLAAYYESQYLSKSMNYSCRTNWDSSFISGKNPKANIYFIWEMIREDFFNNHFSQKKENLLFVGGNNPIKGLKELLIAYNNSIQDLGFKLKILGNCIIEDIQNIIEFNHLKNINSSNIVCSGMQDAKGMIKAYDDSYCLVHPTYIDNSPNSICEAQLSGLPVIATNVGGVSSLIKDRETGFLIDRNPKSIEIAVQELKENNELWNHISVNSRIVARQRHNPDKIIQQTLNMYQELTKEG